jgi:phosphoglycolate phosphatase
LKQYKLIIFDLDGTLTDSGPGIINSVHYALEKMGISEDDRLKLHAFVGPPLIDSFQEFYGMTDKEAWQAIQYYREYFVAQGMFENEVYAGIPALLERLYDSGRYLAVATTKPGVYAGQILEHFDLLKYFNPVAGSNLDGSLMNKSELIAMVLEQYSHLEPQEALMVGDRKFDIQGARLNGIDSLAVSFGYGSREELLNSQPQYMVDSVEELWQLLGDS